MASAIEQARLLLAYNEWSNQRVLLAAEKLTPEQYSELAQTFAHMLRTQHSWHARWTGAEPGEYFVPQSLTGAQAAFSRSHDDLRAFSRSLTAEILDHSERWWGANEELSIGELIVQVVNHGTQHRSEIAVVLTERGCSPNDLDYLLFRMPD